MMTGQPRTMNEDHDCKRARNHALRLLSRRARTEADLSNRLLREGFSRAAVRQCMTSLREDGLVDDEGFVDQYIAYVKDHNPMGRMRIERELCKRGVQKDLARRKVSEITSREEECLARRAIAKKGGLPDSVERDERLAHLRRLFSYLSRRGFPGAMIRRLIGLTNGFV